MMVYWDSSALIASFIEEAQSKKILSYMAGLQELRSYTAIITPLEIESAIQRKLIERAISSKQAEEIRRRLTVLRKMSFLVNADQTVLDIALHLQKIYGLRVADALQLASARAGTEDPSRTHFLCLDKKLSQAAEREGFDVPF